MFEGCNATDSCGSCSAMAWRTPSGITFRISNGLHFRYDVLTNRITPDEGLSEGKLRGDDRDVGPIRDLGEITYGFPLTKCIEMADGSMESLTLETTQQCNCRCKYCLYSGAYDNRRTHSDRVMGAQTIAAALRFYRRHNRNCRAAQISFYGGESLLAFSTIRNAVTEATGLFADKPLSFNVSTNGLLLESDVVKWIADNPNVSVAVTVNGPRHDDYRVTRDGKPTLDGILRNVMAIRERFPTVWERQINFICNIASLSEIRRLRDFYWNVIGKTPIVITGIQLSHASEPITKMFKRGDPARLRLWYDLANEYMRTGDLFLHALYRGRIRHIYRRPIYHGAEPAIAANCIPFISNCFVATNGSINLCEKNCEMTLGNVQGGIDITKVRRLMENARVVFNRKCRSCWAQRLCSICFADMENLLSGNADILERRCLIERENIAADMAIFTEFALFHAELFDRLYAGESHTEGGGRPICEPEVAEELFGECHE